MATRTEEVLLRVAMDQTGVTTGTRKLMDAQKKAAMEYQTFWERALKEKENDAKKVEENITRNEVEQASRRNRARDLLRKREKVQAERHARDMAQVEAGYVPESWRNQSAANRRLGRGRTGAGSATAEGAAASAAMTAVSGGSVDDVAEAAILVGSGSLAGSAATMAAKKLVKASRKLAATLIGRFLGVAAAGFAGFQIGDFLNQKFINKPFAESEANANESAKIVGERLKEMIAGLVKTKELSPEQAERFSALAGTEGGNAFLQQNLKGVYKSPAARARALAAQEDYERRKRNVGIRERISGIQNQMGEINAAFPTIGEIATNQGPLQRVAQTYIWAEERQRAARLRGDVPAAQNFQKWMNIEGDILHKYGLQPTSPLDQMKSMADEINQLNKQLTTGVIKTVVTGTE